MPDASLVETYAALKTRVCRGARYHESGKLVFRLFHQIEYSYYVVHRGQGAHSMGQVIKMRSTPKSAVAEAAAGLRSLAMGKTRGEFLGSEEDLMNALGVSRPTLRQASAQVLQENLIAVRRGVGGGYFVNRPDSSTVSRMAAIYLQSRAVSLDAVLKAIQPLRMELTSLAARAVRGNAHPDAIAQFDERVEREIALLKDDSNYTFKDFLRSEREISRLLTLLSGNEVLSLLLSITYDFLPLMKRDDDVLVNHPERVRIYREARLRVAEAVLDGDEEIALVESRRSAKLFVDWMTAGNQDHSGTLLTMTNPL